EGVAEVGVGVGVDEVAGEDPLQHEAGRVCPLERLKVLGRDPGEATTEVVGHTSSSERTRTPAVRKATAVTPSSPQDGDRALSTASVTAVASASATVARAPRANASVTSTPPSVTTRPSELRSAAGRGVARPPLVSGHT